MRRIFTVIIMMLLFSVVAMSAKGCESKRDYSAKEESLVRENQSTLLTNQPPEKLPWSLEREQINKRTRLWNDPNKVSYIYLISFGRVMAFHAIKGKVSSVNSQITNPMRTEEGYQSITTLPSPAEDGSYGSNGDAVFFFTTDGTYVEWSDTYYLADKPLKLSTPPVFVRQVTIPAK